jgi:hypothetical protein
VCSNKASAARNQYVHNGSFDQLSGDTPEGHQKKLQSNKCQQ